MALAVKDIRDLILERRLRERGSACFGGIVRTARVLPSEEVDALVTDGVDRGMLTEDDRCEALEVDLVIRGRSCEDYSEVLLAVEVSPQVELPDVELAVRVAAILAKLGSPAWPVVAGNGVTGAATRLIRSQAVWQLLDGSVIRPANNP